MFFIDFFLGDVSREWTDVTRQCWRRYQFTASDILSIVRGLANEHGVALHATTSATPATSAATSAAPAIASIAIVASALALRCPDLHDMFSESLGIFRYEMKSANSMRAPEISSFSSPLGPIISSKDSISPTLHMQIVSFFSSFFFFVLRGSDL